jgi:hypothetical protein
VTGKSPPLKDTTLSGLTGYRLQRANSAAAGQFKLHLHLAVLRHHLVG